MRIAVWHNLPSGGGKRALYDHVRGLVERGHTIEVWCPPTADQSYLPLRELAQEHVVPLSWSSNSRPGFQLKTAFNRTPRRIKAMDRHCRQCAEEINGRGFDLLFANACMFFRTTSIARYVRIPAVIYLQEPYRWLYEALPKLPWAALDPPEGGWSLEYLARWFADSVRIRGLRVQAREERRNAQAFISILVNSHYSRESVLRAYGLDAKVCYLGVDTKLFVNRRYARENFVVGIGAFVPEKNIDFIIRSLAHVKPPRPRLVWIGNVQSRSFWEDLIRLAKSKAVDFEPKLSIQDSELVDILNRAQMMVYAPRLEPLGLAALEANACGLPVVAVAEGGVRETIVDGTNGLLVEHDPRAMAAGVQYLLDHPDYAARLGANGAKVVAERWTVDHSVDRLENKLAEALQRAAGKRDG